MSPKQFDQIFQANIEKISRAMNSEVCYTKGFSVLILIVAMKHSCM